MRYNSTLLTLLYSLLFISSANAHESAQRFNEVSLYAQVERDIPNDQMIVLLVSKHDGNNATDTIEKINTEMNWALQIIKQHPAVKSQTQTYQTYPIYDKAQLIIGWHANQQLEVKSTNIANLTKLIGKLQRKLHITHMRFSPTKETRVKHENELIEDAILAFNERVEIIKKHMPYNDHRIVNLDIRTDDGERHASSLYGQQIMGGADLMSISNPPAVEAGSSRVSIVAHGSVQFF